MRSSAARRLMALPRSRRLSSHAGTRLFQVIDCHAAGEPARIVVGGLPHVPGGTMYEKRNHMMEHMDDIRKILITEPRGYPCQNVDYVLPPIHPDAAFGFVIGEQNKIYPAMSGHNTICVATALLESGMVPMVEPVTTFTLEAPAGLIEISARVGGGKALEVTLRNTPGFCRPQDMDVVVDVPTFGEVTLDVAYGGMHYAIVDAASVGLALLPKHGRELCRLGEMIKVAAREQHPVQHPEIDYPGCDILVFREPARRDEETGRVHAKNAVIMSNNDLDWDKPETWTGMIDRSPCGTGTCAVMASLHARGELAIGEEFVHESIVGTHFVGRVLEEVTVGEPGTPEAVKGNVMTISGRGWVTQHATVVVDPTDPFPQGYTVGDIW